LEGNGDGGERFAESIIIIYDAAGEALLKVSLLYITAAGEALLKVSLLYIAAAGVAKSIIIIYQFGGKYGRQFTKTKFRVGARAGVDFF
jgi:hypothetical protein